LTCSNWKRQYGRLSLTYRSGEEIERRDWRKREQTIEREMACVGTQRERHTQREREIERESERMICGEF